MDELDFQGFGGGQIEIQTARNLYRGSIAQLTEIEGGLLVNLTWMAQAEGFPPFPKSWKKTDRTSVFISQQAYQASNIGPGSYGSDRLCFTLRTTGEIIVLFPPNGSRLEEPTS